MSHAHDFVPTTDDEFCDADIYDEHGEAIDRCGNLPQHVDHQRVPGQPGEQDTAEEPALTQQEQDGLDYP